MKTLFFSVCLFLASVSATAQQRYSQEMAQSQGKQCLSSTYKCNFLGADNKQ